MRQQIVALVLVLTGINTTQGIGSQIIGTVGGNGQFSDPTDVAVGWSGHVWVADRVINRIEEFSGSGTYLMQVGGYGSGNGQFNLPSSIAVDPSGDVWVADTNNHRLQEFSGSGTWLRTVGSQGDGNGHFYYPYGVNVDPLGNSKFSITP